MKERDVQFQEFMRVAAKACLDTDAAAFEALDTSDTVISRKTERKIQRMIRNGIQNNVGTFKVLKRLAAACMIICTVLFGISMSIQPVRAAFRDAILSWYDEYIRVFFVEKTEGFCPSYIEKAVCPEYLPEGWTMELHEKDQTSVIYRLDGTKEELIFYEQTIAGETDVWFDNTNCTVQDIQLKNGCEGYLLLYPDESVSLIWKDGYLYTLVGYGVAESVLLEIADSIG